MFTLQSATNLPSFLKHNIKNITDHPNPWHDIILIYHNMKFYLGMTSFYCRIFIDITYNLRFGASDVMIYVSLNIHN